MNSLARRMLVVIVALSVAPAASAAGLFRAYLSTSGNDANTCTLEKPCRLLPAALNAVADGGEIWMVDSANYNTAQVNISKSVTILAVPGSLGSVVATGGGHGIFINAAGIRVTLRNLVITRLGSSSDGVSMAQGTQLTVEDCEISNVAGSGIAAYDTTAGVSIKNTVLRNNNAGFYARGPIVASLDGVHSEGNADSGVYADAGSNVTVSNSILRRNGRGLYAIAAFVNVDRSHSDYNTTYGVQVDDGTAASISNSVLADNGSAGALSSALTFSFTRITLTRSVVSGGFAGASVSGGAGTAQIYVGESVFASCNTAFTWAGKGGIEGILTYANNRVTCNTINSGGSLGNVANEIY